MQLGNRPCPLLEHFRLEELAEEVLLHAFEEETNARSPPDISFRLGPMNLKAIKVFFEHLFKINRPNVYRKTLC